MHRFGERRSPYALLPAAGGSADAPVTAEASPIMVTIEYSKVEKNASYVIPYASFDYLITGRDLE